MRKLIMWNLVTLDGFFEGPRAGDIDFHDTVWGEELERFSLEQLRNAGLLLFGRVTYQFMADYWPSEMGEIADLMNSIPKVVFSRTLDRAEWANTELVSANAVERVAELKEQPGRDILIFGSANLASTLTESRLIDEYRIAVAPVLLGSGSPLFKPGLHYVKLRLLEARPLTTGGVILRYERPTGQ